MNTDPPATLSALPVSLTPRPLTKWERERQAFQQLLPQLLQTYLGQYVAIHEERLVGSDTNDIALIQRVHAQFGYVPIFVERVTAQPQIARLPHYREYRPERAE